MKVKVNKMRVKIIKNAFSGELEEVYKYIENELRLVLCNTSTTVSAIEVRTFDNGISKKHLQMFPVLENYKDKDISYIIYSTLSIL